MADELDQNVDVVIPEKLKQIQEFFKENGLEPSIEVSNALGDVFSENDEDTIDQVNIYYRSDLEEFCKDMTLQMQAIIRLNGPSEGQCHSVYTYFGEMEISLSEFVKLYNNINGEDRLIEDITNIDNSGVMTKVLNPDSFIVTLLETTTWENNQYRVIRDLKIYCPVDEDEEGAVE